MSRCAAPIDLGYDTLLRVVRCMPMVHPFRRPGRATIFAIKRLSACQLDTLFAVALAAEAVWVQAFTHRVMLYNGLEESFIVLV